MRIGGLLLEQMEELPRRHAQMRACALDELLPLAPGQHHEGHGRGDEKREPAAVEQLGRVRGEEDEIDQEQEAVQQIDEHGPVAPMQGDEGRQDRGDHHVERDRKAVGAGEAARRSEAEDGREGQQGEGPVHERDVDMPALVARRMDDPHPGQEAELDRLLRQGEGPGDHRLRGDDGGERRQDDQRIMRPVRRQMVERALEALGMGQQQGALAEIVQHQGRQNDEEPGHPDRGPGRNGPDPRRGPRRPSR